MSIALRFLALIILLLWPHSASAQWEGRTWIDDWIERNFGDGAEGIAADPGRIAAEAARGSATWIRDTTPPALAALSTRLPWPANAIAAGAANIPKEYNGNAYLLDRMAGAFEQLPPRYRPTPIIKKPGTKAADLGRFPEFEVIPPARDAREAINLPPVRIQGKAEPIPETPKEHHEGWSNQDEPVNLGNVSEEDFDQEVQNEAGTPEELTLQEGADELIVQCTCRDKGTHEINQRLGTMPLSECIRQISQECDPFITCNCREDYGKGRILYSWQARRSQCIPRRPC